VQVGRQAMADRYTYLPLIGIFLCVVWAVAESVGNLGNGGVLGFGTGAARHDLGMKSEPRKPKSEGRNPKRAGLMPGNTYDPAQQDLSKGSGLRLSNFGLRPAFGFRISACFMAGAGLAVVLGCAMLTQRQLGYWRDNVTLFQHALAVTSYNSPAYLHVGVGLAHERKFPAALEHFRAALQWDPEDADTRYNLGRVLMETGKLEQAIQQFRLALGSNPAHALAHKSLGAALWKYGQPAEALLHYTETVRLKPDDPEAQYLLGLALVEQRKYPEAEAHIQQAVKLKPGYAEALAGLDRARALHASAHENLGLLLARQGRLADAVVEFREAICLQPNASAHYNLGRAYEAKGDLREAVTEYYVALRLKPGWAVVDNNLAWLLATAPQANLRSGPEAVRLAERAAAATGASQSGVLDTLAAAYAEAGRWPEAISTAEKARDLASSRGDKRLAEAVEARLACYRQHQPFHSSQ
jgi:protein O-mannosyl-transferase